MWDDETGDPPDQAADVFASGGPAGSNLSPRRPGRRGPEAVSVWRGPAGGAGSGARRRQGLGCYPTKGRGSR